MATIELRALGHRYREKKTGKTFSVENLNITWADGTANALLGPSGCGKTTLLNAISGLLRPKTGKVLFDGKDVTRLSPKKRHIAQVFQFPVVYDSLSTFDNLAFPLRNSRVAEADVTRRVEHIGALLGLEDVFDRKARTLTAAQKQIVSLGRGIVREDTAAVLFDEPLTVIDPNQKHDLRRRLREVQRNLKMTMIYVTHDQHEALTFADHVTVMYEGAIIQTATPAELHEYPATPFVGFFIGSPGMNLFDVSFSAGGLVSAGHVMPLDALDRLDFGGRKDGFQIGIRPEFVETFTESTAGALRTSVELVEDTGAYKVLSLANKELRLKARVREHFDRGEGADVWVRFPAERVRVFLTEGASA